MGKSEIGWADWTTNFYTFACTKVSQGCKNCYALALAKKYHNVTEGRPEWRGDKALADFKKQPYKAVNFINDMSDTYHEYVQFAYIQTIHKEIKHTRPDATCLVLTKRIERALELSPKLDWSDNLWLGTSVENKSVLHRIATLRRTPALHKFLSIEPLLEDLGDVDLTGVDWVIVGGESGEHRRPMDKRWAANIRRQCEEQSVPFFFKQGNDLYPGKDRLLEGKEWNAFPPQFTPIKFQKRDEFVPPGVDQLKLF